MTTGEKFKELTKLFEPIYIGTMQVKNRLVMAPMGIGAADEAGNVTPRLLEYYAARARNDICLIIVQSTSVGFYGRTSPRQLSAYDDAFIPGLKKLVQSMYI